MRDGLKQVEMDRFAILVTVPIVKRNTSMKSELQEQNNK